MTSIPPIPKIPQTAQPWPPFTAAPFPDAIGDPAEPVTLSLDLGPVGELSTVVDVAGCTTPPVPVPALLDPPPEMMTVGDVSAELAVAVPLPVTLPPPTTVEAPLPTIVSLHDVFPGAEGPLLVATAVGVGKVTQSVVVPVVLKR